MTAVINLRGHNQRNLRASCIDEIVALKNDLALLELRLRHMIAD